MTKYINIDELAPEKKVLTLKGVDHEMHQVTVGEYIDMMRSEKEVADDVAGLPVHERVAKMIDNIIKAFPTVDRAELECLSIQQLVTIIKFVMGSLEEEAQAKEEAGRGTKKK